MWEKFAPYA